jgi:hypothetical protein
MLSLGGRGAHVAAPVGRVRAPVAGARAKVDGQLDEERAALNGSGTRNLRRSLGLELQRDGLKCDWLYYPDSTWNGALRAALGDHAPGHHEDDWRHK